MQKAQVFLRDDQKEQLKSIALRTGKKQSELIRRGVDMIIEKTLKDQGDWKVAMRSVYGIWKERDDIDDLYKDMRGDLNKRHQKLFPDAK